MELDNCFVCLKQTSHKVCEQCNCVCHPICWIKYCSKFCKEENFTKSHVKCPLCRRQINDNIFLKPKTRLQTKEKRHAEFKKMLLQLDSLLDDNSSDGTICYETLDRVYDLLTENKEFWYYRKEAHDCVSKTLQLLFKLKKYKAAKFYHWKLFNCHF